MVRSYTKQNIIIVFIKLFMFLVSWALAYYFLKFGSNVPMMQLVLSEATIVAMSLMIKIVVPEKMFIRTCNSALTIANIALAILVIWRFATV